MVERGEITMTRAYECSKLYNPNGGLKNAGNPQNVRDGDIWVQAYLVARGIKAFDVPEVDYGEDHV